MARGALSSYFGSDLIHRLLHMPSVAEGAAAHFADSYAACLALARDEPARAARNAHTLQYFALDAYALDVAVPGEGCAGKPAEEGEGEGEGTEGGHGGHGAAAPPTTTATTSREPSATSAAPAVSAHRHETS